MQIQKPSIVTQTNIGEMQRIIQIFEEKLSVSDASHCLQCRFISVTSEWIRSLEEQEQSYLFEYLQYCLDRPGPEPRKTAILMLLGELPCPRSKELLDKILAEGTSKHTELDIGYAANSRRRLSEKYLDIGNRRIIMDQNENAVRFYRKKGASYRNYATFRIPQEHVVRGVQLYDLYMEGNRPATILTGTGTYDIVVILDMQTGAALHWHYTK